MPYTQFSQVPAMRQRDDDDRSLESVLFIHIVPYVLA